MRNTLFPQVKIIKNEYNSVTTRERQSRTSVAEIDVFLPETCQYSP